MKTKSIILLGLISILTAGAQSSEFEVYPNGLIYSARTMNKLALIVDSLNLKFRTCDMNKVFYARQQTTGHLVELESGNITAAKRDMEKQMPLEEFLKKYPTASVERNVLVIRSKYTNYEDKQVVSIAHFDFKSDYDFKIESSDPSLFDKDLQYQWLLAYYDKSSYSEESLKAFYFPDKFVSKPLPHKYALMVGYADCLIDTTTAKFKENLTQGWVDLPKNWTSLSERKSCNCWTRCAAHR